MPTVHTVPTDYATLAAALAHADVKDGDTIQIHDTHTVSTADVTVSKQVTIKTLGSGQATISKKIIVDASNVTLTNLKLNAATQMIAVNTGKTIKSLTISYCTFDCNGQTANISNNLVYVPHTNYTSGTVFSGVFTFDNNTILQSRSSVSIQLSSTDSGTNCEELYVRDNKFIDHTGVMVFRGGNYKHYQGSYLATAGDASSETKNYTFGPNGNLKHSDKYIDKAVVSGNKVNVDGAAGTVAAAAAAKAAGGASDGSAKAVSGNALSPWGLFEVNQCKDVEFTTNVIKNMASAYKSAACFQTWAQCEWTLNMKNNIFQDCTGMGGAKIYTRYYGWGYRYDGSSFGYMPNGKVEKNDFINCDLFALKTDCKYKAGTDIAASALHDNFTLAQFQAANPSSKSGSNVGYPTGYNKKSVWGSRQKWANYDTHPTLNAQNNYFFPTTGQAGTDVSGQVLAVSDNRPPRVFNVKLNIAEGDATMDFYLDSDGTSWVIAPGNKSSIESAFNYTSFPHEDENSVLLQQGAVATVDTRNYSLVRHNQYLDYQTYTLYSADPSNNIAIQIPVLFDVSGSALLYGEEYEDDMIDAHLQFTLDMRTDATNSFKVDDLTGCFRVGDQDVSGHNLFYVNNHVDTSGNQVDLFCEKLSKAILEGNLKHIVNDGDHSTGGIPIGGQALVTSDGSANSLGTYTKKYLTSIAPVAGSGENVGTCMARLAAVHLVGHPLSQALFTNEKMLQTDVARVTNINKGDATTKFANTLATQLSKALGGSYTNKHDGVGGDPSGNRVLLPGLAAANDNTSGVETKLGTVNPVLQSIYEQLIANGGRATEINPATDLSLNDSDVTKTTTAAFPFHANDELVVYIRPKLHLTFDTAVQTGVAILDSDGTAMDISGLVHRDALASNMAVAFPGCSAGQKGGQAYRYSWMGSPDNVRSSGNGRDLDQETTDETDPSVLDAHVWKITIKL